MTPLMVRALSDAEACAITRGLVRSCSGWITTNEIGHCWLHRAATIRALVDRGYLSLWRNGEVAHITDAGQAALARWREASRSK